MSKTIIVFTTILVMTVVNYSIKAQSIPEEALLGLFAQCISKGLQQIEFNEEQILKLCTCQKKEFFEQYSNAEMLDYINYAMSDTTPKHVEKKMYKLNLKCTKTATRK